MTVQLHFEQNTQKKKITVDQRTRKVQYRAVALIAQSNFSDNKNYK